MCFKEKELETFYIENIFLLNSINENKNFICQNDNFSKVINLIMTNVNLIYGGNKIYTQSEINEAINFYYKQINKLSKD